MQQTQETRVRSLGQEGPLEEGVVTHSSVLAWRVPCTEEPFGLQHKALQRTEAAHNVPTCVTSRYTRITAAVPTCVTSPYTRITAALATCVTSHYTRITAALPTCVTSHIIHALPQLYPHV